MARRKRIKYKIYIDRDFKTVATRNRETGRLTGRKAVPGFGDKTAVRRVSSPQKYSGEIFGRTHPIPIRGSERNRGSIRRTL